MNNSRFFFLFLLIARLLIADSDSFYLASEHASYNGKQLLLKGDIHLDHTFGKVRSEKAWIEGLHSLEDDFPMHIYLEEKVEFLFPTHASLFCDKAHFDYSLKKAFFFGKKVRYEDSKNLKIKCLQMEAELDQALHKKALSIFDLQTLVFQEEVEIFFDMMRAEGGKAIFKRHQLDEEKKFLGFLDLFPSLPNSHCHLFHDQGEIIAKSVRFDLLKNHLFFESPKGKLNLSEPLFFSSKNLTWQKKEGLWVFEEQVFLNNASFFLSADKASLVYGLKNEEFPESILFEGNVHFISKESLPMKTVGFAESVRYFPSEKKLVLKSPAPKKVLLLQEENSLQLTAPEIHISKDPFTSKEQAQGIGEVRFTFQTEEEKKLVEFFEKHLNFE